MRIVPAGHATFWRSLSYGGIFNLANPPWLGRWARRPASGIILQGAIDTFKWPEVATILLAIIALVDRGGGHLCLSTAPYL